MKISVVITYDDDRTSYLYTPFTSLTEPSSHHKAPLGLYTDLIVISMNAPVLVDLDGATDPLIIAGMELREKKLPLKIRRFLPDGSYEDWGADE